MFFYVSLFLACVIAAFIVLYLYHALADVGKAVYRNFLPTTMDKRTSHLEQTRFRSSINDTTVPWGWKGNGSEARGHGAKRAAVNGASGFDALINNHGNDSASVGWPYREESTEFTGKSYKVSRKTGSVKTNRSSGDTPWGW